MEPVKQTLFSFFDAIKWCWHSGFKRTDMYSVVSFLAYQIFWCSNGAYFVTLTAYRWINSFFICWIQVSLRFSAKNFWENTCLFFHFLQQAPCNIGFLHFFFNNFATLDSYIRGTKVNFSSISLFFWFSKCGYGIYALISSTAVSMISNLKEVNLFPANIFQLDEVRL